MGLDKVILDLRNYHGVSQKHVADSIGISQSTIAKIEIGRNEATASTIKKLADYFQVSADYLLERTDEFGSSVSQEINSAAFNLSPDEERIIKNFRAMRSDLQTYYVEMSETFILSPEAIAREVQEKKT